MIFGHHLWRIPLNEEDKVNFLCQCSELDFQFSWVVFEIYSYYLDFQMQKVERLQSLCLQYAAATQWLISSSIDIPKLDELSDGSVGNSKSPSREVKLTSRNAAVTDSIL